MYLEHGTHNVLLNTKRQNKQGLNLPLTCATPSSQPLMTSLCPILNLKGLFLSREESNFFPFCNIPAKKTYENKI